MEHYPSVERVSQAVENALSLVRGSRRQRAEAAVRELADWVTN